MRPSPEFMRAYFSGRLASVQEARRAAWLATQREELAVRLREIVRRYPRAYRGGGPIMSMAALSASIGAALSGAAISYLQYKVKP